MSGIRPDDDNDDDGDGDDGVDDGDGDDDGHADDYDGEDEGRDGVGVDEKYKQKTDKKGFLNWAPKNITKTYGNLTVLGSTKKELVN